MKKGSKKIAAFGGEKRVKNFFAKGGENGVKKGSHPSTAMFFPASAAKFYISFTLFNYFSLFYFFKFFYFELL